MRYLFIVLLLLFLCACQTTSPQIQTSESVSAPEIYNSCVQVYTMNALSKQQTPNVEMAVNEAMGICSSQYVSMRKSYVRDSRSAGFKPTNYSEGLFDKKAKKAIRKFYIDYFNEMLKG